MNWINIILATTICAVFLILASKIPSKPETDSKPEQKNDFHIDNQWAFYLINNENQLSEDIKVTLSMVTDRFYLDERCTPYAIDMLENAKKDGVKLLVSSAHRSVKYQEKNFENYYLRLKSEGISDEDAMSMTLSQIAHPLSSEHVAGLALDIVSEDWWTYNDELTTSFEQTAEFKWLKDNSWKYGFILRYPDGKQDITGISYEPWHYRFVGIYHADKIYKSGLTLEEYYQKLKNDT